MINIKGSVIVKIFCFWLIMENRIRILQPIAIFAFIFLVNSAEAQNTEVRVNVKEVLALYVGPTPMLPTSLHERNRLTVVNTTEAINWIKNDGGILFVLELPLPEDSSAPLPATLEIVSRRGEIIREFDSDDIIQPQWREFWHPGDAYQIGFCWNGARRDGSLASGGHYKQNYFLNRRTTKMF
jgi:hypothetical protein